MKLFLTLAKIEAVRLKLHLLLSAILTAFFILWLGIDFTSMEGFNFTMETSGTMDLGADQQSLITMDALLALSEIFIPLTVAILGICLLLILLPFRGPREWQEGQFQLIKMCSWSLYQIQLSRFVIYFLFGTLCMGLLLFSASCAVIMNEQAQVPYLLGDAMALFAYTLMLTIPLSISIGMVIDATRSAYLLRGINILISFIQITGWMALMDLSQRWINYFKLGLPAWPIRLAEQIPSNTYQGPTHLYMEPIILSAIITIVFVVLSARILEEAEA